MRSWQVASLVYFVYAAATAFALPQVRASARRQGYAFAGLGLLLIAAASACSGRPILTMWVLPPALLLVAYWTSGSLFAAPMPAAEDALMAVDRRLRIRGIAAALPRGVAELLEVAYSFVYPLIPLAFGLYILFARRPDADTFWMVILTTDYVCFGMLPWIQTRPPRSLETGAPWRSSFRRVNARLLDRASIHVNTVPSGHAAEAVAAALLLADAPPPVLASMSLVAAAICAGAVLGRYHYATDVLAGAAVGFAVWICA